MKLYSNNPIMIYQILILKFQLYFHFCFYFKSRKFDMDFSRYGYFNFFLDYLMLFNDFVSKGFYLNCNLYVVFVGVLNLDSAGL